MAERQVTIRVKADGSNVVQTFRLMGKEGELALTNIRNAAKSQKQSFDNLGNAMDKTRNRGAALNGGMRNVALQLSQVGQQTVATGDFVRALAIQLPDLALGFGTVGIALGVVAGVGLPLLANALFDTEEKSGTLKDQLSELDAATKSYQAAVERLRSPMADMREEFGKNAAAARRLFKAQAEFARIEAIDALSNARESLVDQFGDISGISEEAARAADQIIAEFRRIDEEVSNAAPGANLTGQLDTAFARLAELRPLFVGLQGPIQQITEELGVSEAAAAEFLATLVQFRDAESGEARVAANERLVQLYGEAVGANGKLTEEQRAGFRALIESLEAQIRFNATQESAVDTSGRVAGNIKAVADEMNRAASEAIRFVSNLGTRSLAGVRAEVAALEGGGSRVAGQVARREADIRSSDEFQAALQGPEGLRREAIEGLQREIELTREAAELEERRGEALRALNETRTGGGSGGGAARSLQELNEAARQTESIIRQAQQAAVGYAEVVSLLDEALRAGKISQEDYNRALELARERFDRVGEGARESQEEFKRFARSALTDIKNVGDALDQLANSLFSRTIGAGVDGIFSKLQGLGGGAGGGQGLLGLGGFLGFLDSGGRIGAGQFAVVGERRPEIVTGPANVIGGAETARLMQGGGGGANVSVQVFAPEGTSVREEREQTPDGERVRIFLDQTVADLASQPGTAISRALGGGFGLRPVTRSR